jgi:hypothetical protein
MVFDRRATRLQRHTQGSPVATAAPESSGVSELRSVGRGARAPRPLFSAPRRKAPHVCPARRVTQRARRPRSPESRTRCRRNTTRLPYLAKAETSNAPKGPKMPALIFFENFAARFPEKE